MFIKSAILFLLTAAVALAAPRFSSIRQSLEYWEGVRSYPYRDPNHANGWHHVVGIGHNLTSRNQFVRATRRYSRTEIDAFFRSDLSEATRAARSGVTDFETLPYDVKQVVIGLIWTVGPSGFKSFINFRKALSNRHYRTAANELASSRWARQVSRARVEWSVGVLKSVGGTKP